MKVKVTEIAVPGASLNGTDPLPKFRRQTGFQLFDTKDGFPEFAKKDLGACTRTLPYRVQDRYGRERRIQKLKVAVLENEYLRATVTPGYGGKLWSLYDKENKREILMSNPVIQPGNLAIRNAWTSGGIEWNFGSLGHTYFTCDDVWTAVLDDGEGNEFLRFYEFERAKECFFQVDLHLPEGSRQLFSHVKVVNPGGDTTTYWWTNVAIPQDGGTRVLSSSEDVIVVCGGEGLSYEKLPHLSVMDGDLSYPHNATRSFDYFFQPEDGVKTTWEGGVNKKGFAFYDRSTAPLVYHKMFCWGNHRGGDRWQEFLSDGRRGDYIELQAGFARSQLHDKPFPAHSSIEWTQCFGGTRVDPDTVHGLTLHEANGMFGLVVSELIPENTLIRADEKYSRLADMKVEESSVIHRGSGWGALHLRLCPDIETPLCFPGNSLGEEQRPWLSLLDGGVIENADPGLIPSSWMVSDKWIPVLEKSFDRPGGDNWLSRLHYGNMMFEYFDNAHTVPTAVSFDASGYEKRAEEAWLASDSLTPNVWAKRNLALLYLLRGDKARTEALDDAIMEMPASLCDFAFAAEYLGRLISDGKYEKAWRIYEGLPENMKRVDRIALHAAKLSVKLEKFDLLDGVFEREYADIREGETSLTDLWFEYKARLTASLRGERFDSYDDAEKAEALERAEKDFPPPHEIDFRMSYDKTRKYRATE